MKTITYSSYTRLCRFWASIIDCSHSAEVEQGFAALETFHIVLELQCAGTVPDCEV